MGKRDEGEQEGKREIGSGMGRANRRETERARRMNRNMQFLEVGSGRAL